MALFSRVSDCFPGQHGVPRGTAQSVARHSRRDLVGATTRDLLGGGVLATESFYELEDWRRSKPQQRVDIHNHLQRFFSKKKLPCNFFFYYCPTILFEMKRKSFLE